MIDWLFFVSNHSYNKIKYALLIQIHTDLHSEIQNPK